MAPGASDASHRHMGALGSNQECEPLPGFRGNGLPQEHQIEITALEVIDRTLDPNPWPVFG